MNIGILWPTFALVLLIFVIWFTLFVHRIGHIKHTPPTAADFADSQAALRYFRPVEMPANNLANLFEMPVLYFALVPLLLVLNHAGSVQVVLAWAYVLLRAVHSFIHIVTKQVRLRAFVYLASCVVLSAMWVGLAVETLRTAAVGG